MSDTGPFELTQGQDATSDIFWKDVVKIAKTPGTDQELQHMLPEVTHFPAFSFVKLVEELFAQSDRRHLVRTFLTLGTATDNHRLRSRGAKMQIIRRLLRRLEEQDQFLGEDEASEVPMTPNDFEDSVFELIETNPELLEQASASKSGLLIHEAARLGRPTVFRRLLRCMSEHHLSAYFNSLDKQKKSPLRLILDLNTQRSEMLDALFFQMKGIELDGSCLEYLLKDDPANSDTEVRENALFTLLSCPTCPACVAQSIISKVSSPETNISKQNMQVLLSLENVELRSQRLLHAAVVRADEDLFQKLLLPSPGLAEEIDMELVRQAVKHRVPVSMLEQILEPMKHDLYGHNLLHLALSSPANRDAKAVMASLLNFCPKLAIEREGTKTPCARLQERQSDWKQLNLFSEVRDLIVSSIIKLPSSAYGQDLVGFPILEKIRHFLEHGVEDARREICLDLGRSPSFSSAFLKLIRRDLGDKSAIPVLDIKFEPTLRFVNIPVPVLQISSETINHGRGVKQIYELRVRDSLYNPHTEQSIKSCFHDLQIEVLHWRRLDLSVRPLLLSSIQDNLQRLSLHAGTWSTLHHWTSIEVQEMLHDNSCFKKLELIEIYIEQDLVGEELSQEYLRLSTERIDLARETMMANATTKSWKPAFHISKGWSSQAPKIQSSYDRPWYQRTAAERTGITAFLQAYRSLHMKLSSADADDWRRDYLVKTHRAYHLPSKVAIIDTGVDLSECLEHKVEGASFVPSDHGESPWFLPHHRHGSQMAAIITNLDPRCRLLIAKVGDHRDDMRATWVINAMRWAIERDADIISFSGSFDEAKLLADDKTEFQIVVKDATDRGIIICASTEGMGHTNVKVLPAENDAVFAIGSSRFDGKEAEGTILERTDFMFPGENITMDDMSKGPSEGAREVSGTSAATAVAAGVASLIISCDRLHLIAKDTHRSFDEPSDALSRRVDTHWNHHMKFRAASIKKAFKNMWNEKGKYVRPGDFFKAPAGQEGWGQPEDTLRWICERFLELEN